MKVVDAINHHTGRLLEMPMSADAASAMLQHMNVMRVDHLL